MHAVYVCVCVRSTVRACVCVCEWVQERGVYATSSEKCAKWYQINKIIKGSQFCLWLQNKFLSTFAAFCLCCNCNGNGNILLQLQKNLIEFACSELTVCGGVSNCNSPYLCVCVSATVSTCNSAPHTLMVSLALCAAVWVCVCCCNLQFLSARNKLFEVTLAHTHTHVQMLRVCVWMFLCILPLI